MVNGPWHKPLILPGMAYNYGKLTKDVIAEIFPPAADPWLSYVKSSEIFKGKHQWYRQNALRVGHESRLFTNFSIFTSVI